MAVKDKVDESKPFVCSNQNCGRRFKVKDSLKRHLRTACGGGVEYPCSLCTLTYKSFDALRRHKKEKHQNDMSLDNAVSVEQDFLPISFF